MSNKLAIKIIWINGVGRYAKKGAFVNHPYCEPALPVSAVIEWLKDKEAESGLSIVSNYTFKKLIPELRAIEQEQEP